MRTRFAAAPVHEMYSIQCWWIQARATSLVYCPVRTGMYWCVCSPRCSTITSPVAEGRRGPVVRGEECLQPQLGDRDVHRGAEVAQCGQQVQLPVLRAEA